MNLLMFADVAEPVVTTQPNFHAVGPQSLSVEKRASLALTMIEKCAG
jgi:hypothetical protein